MHGQRDPRGKCPVKALVADRWTPLSESKLSLTVIDDGWGKIQAAAAAAATADTVSSRLIEAAANKRRQLPAN